MGIKRLAIFGAVAAVFVAVFFLFKPSSKAEPLRVFTWSNYYPDAILEDFQKTTGIPLELSYFSSNEELFAKFKAGATGYDVIQPSDYMVRQMAKLGMLAELKHDQLSNLSHLEDYFRNLPYDPGLKHSVPFTFGTTGISVNTAKVKVPADGISWKFLLETGDLKHTSLLDDMREVFGAVLMLRGHSLNERQPAALETARGDIAKVKSKILMFSSEPRPLLLKEEINVAHIFSFDAVQVALENPSIQYFIPKEGATMWTDNFAIPKSAKKVAEAHAFINYFLNPDNAVKIALQNHLALPNKTAKQRLPPEQLSNPGLYPSDETRKKLEFLDDPGDLLNTIHRMWNELKSS